MSYFKAIKVEDGTTAAQYASVDAGGAVKVDNSGVTQPVSGTVTVQQGTAANLKVDLSGTAANSTAIKVDNSAVTQPVSGTVTVQQSTAANLKVDLSGTGANSTAIKVDNSAVTQPVSGSVTVSATDLDVRDLSSTTDSVKVEGGNTSAVKVDGSAVTQPVSGTVTVSATDLDIRDLSSVSDSVKVEGGNTSAVKVDGSAVTQPVSGTVAVTTIKPDGTNTMPSLDTTARRGYIQQSDQFGYSADCTPNSELITTDKIRLVGAIFNGTTVDPNFWTAYTSTGTVTQVSSELVLTSGTANGHYAVVQSVRRANWITGTSNKFRTQMRIESADADITCRVGVGWGATMPTITDGAYFKFVGSTLSVNTMANSVETSVASGDFNGTYSAPTLTNNNTFEILYTLGKVYFLINNVIIHTATFATAHWTSNTTNFYIGADVRNTGDSAAVKYIFRMMNICRLGSIVTKPTYKRISGNAATYVLKYGGGMLHKIMFNNTSGTSLTIYDDSAATVGKEIGIITTASAALGAWSYDCPFFNGLTMVTVGNGLDATIVYE